MSKTGILQPRQLRTVNKLMDRNAWKGHGNHNIGNLQSTTKLRSKVSSGNISSRSTDSGNVSNGNSTDWDGVMAELFQIGRFHIQAFTVHCLSKMYKTVISSALLSQIPMINVCLLPCMPLGAS